MAYRTEFTVGAPGAPVDGQTNYYNSLLAGSQFRVFREGLFQYQSGANRIFNTGSGTIFFIPALYAGERIKIII
jgi:hypothetical protein